MISGVQNIHYYVQDMDRAVAFYQKALGASVVFGSEYWTSLNLFGLTLGLHGNEGRPVPAVPCDEHGAKAGGTLTLKSDNIVSDRKMLEGLGATVVGEFKAEWGHLLVFKDLDGNILNLQHPSY
jgi:catechol 2,3-dioxygenase-like lactoylglutathione lyase family enzyme